ncbi:MAG: ROK family protein [Candidatus Kerfeldbacteria bacterium]|nr:ROK family protein [Candidatus Kerfeldbacteria bacterium]
MPRRTIGLDIGGTKIQVGIITDAHQVIASDQLPNDIRDTARTLKSITQAIDRFFSTQTIGGIGVGITGTVDTATGIVAESPNLPHNWHRVPLQKILEKKYRVPVRIDNDANCIALAEATVGLGKKYNTVLSITIGTGIGAGLVINKRIYHGGFNAVEFGHTIIESPSLARCSCGRYGHFEALVSGRALQSIYRQKTGAKLSSYDIVAAARAGKRVAKQVMARASTSLAIGLANAIHAYSPEIIVLGGGLAHLPMLIKPALKHMRPLIAPAILKKTKIVVSKLHYDAGVIGATLIVPRHR